MGLLSYFIAMSLYEMQCLRGITTALDFAGLTDNLLALHQSLNLSNSLFILSIKLKKVGSHSNKPVSSANNLGAQLTEFGRSLMYNKKSKGPIVDPRATPQLIDFN